MNDLDAMFILLGSGVNGDCVNYVIAESAQKLKA